MNDFCFKELMQNAKVRQGFIAAILGKDPKEIVRTELLPTEMRRDYVDDKLAILDVRVCLVNGTQMDLEMQVEYFDSWDKRVLFYLAKMYTDQLKKGESYEVLKKCIHVGILNFVHFPENEKCYHIIHLYNERTGKRYSDLLELHILELPKLPALLNAMKPGMLMPDEEVVHWMEFFRGKTKEEFEMIAKENEYVEEAVNRLFEISADEKKRLEYEQREKAIRDYRSQMKSAEQRGISQTILKMRKYMSVEEIAEILEEPVIEIEKLISEKRSE